MINKLIFIPSIYCRSIAKGMNRSYYTTFRLDQRARRMIPLRAQLAYPRNKSMIRYRLRSISFLFIVFTLYVSPEIMENAPIATRQTFSPSYNGTCFNHSIRQSLGYNQARITSKPYDYFIGLGRGILGLFFSLQARTNSQNNRSSFAFMRGT